MGRACACASVRVESDWNSRNINIINASAQRKYQIIIIIIKITICNATRLSRYRITRIIISLRYERQFIVAHNTINIISHTVKHCYLQYLLSIQDVKINNFKTNFTYDAEHRGHGLPVMVQHGPVVVLRVLPVPQLGPPVHFGYQTADLQRTLAGHGRGGWTPARG